MCHKEKITICQRCDITLCNKLQYPVYIVGNPTPSDDKELKELKELEDWAIDRIEDITKLIHYQPIDIVDRAFEPNGKPKFDIILSYEDCSIKYKRLKPKDESKLNDIKDLKGNEKELEKAIENLKSDDFIIEETEKSPSGCLGYYKIYGRYGRPEVVLLLQNIYNLYKTDDKEQEKEQKRKDSVTLTYIHELMHAVMHVHTNNEFIEEPLAEMGMLCFVHDAYANLATTADNEVKAKQNNDICHYGFGKFLYDTLWNQDYGWNVGNLMKQYIIMSEALSDCFEYEKYFIACYPNGALQESALKKLFKILRLYPIQVNHPDCENEILYEWSKGSNA